MSLADKIEQLPRGEDCVTCAWLAGQDIETRQKFNQYVTDQRKCSYPGKWKQLYDLCVEAGYGYTNKAFRDHINRPECQP